MTTKRTVELYNLFERPGQLAPFNGWLVRETTPTTTVFVRFGRDEHAARDYAARTPLVGQGY